MRNRQMIRVFCVLTAVFLAASGCAYADDKNPEKKVTIMLYLCGSDLESRNKQGTTTIESILNSGFDRDAVNVVALLGGTEQWWSGYDPSVLSLITFDNDRSATLLDTRLSASMGDPETLTAFLEYCHDHYPAERYDLIIWDHGGGPNDGVCWDEIYEEDHLPLTELLQALDSSPFRDKGLDILCFDACLMGSAEVAVQVSPYARYMVATEDSMYGSPADWLNGIDRESSYDTAVRWIDGCFEYNVSIAERQKGSPLVSVSLVDLSCTGDLKQAADDFFGPVSEALDEESFTGMAGRCRQAVVFGVMSPNGESQYDLVDLGDLARQYRDIAPLQADRLMSAVRKCVPYQRSVSPDVMGVTVYHPLFNKIGAVSWMPIHSCFALSERYSAYIMKFVSILTGTPLAKWEKLVAARAPAVRDNRVLFILDLTEDQAAHLSDSDMLVLKKNGDGTCSFIHRTNETQLMGGTVTGEYNGTALYAVDAGGDPVSPPIPCVPSDTGTVRIPAVVGCYGTNDRKGFEAKAAVTCGYDASSGQLVPGAVALWDERMGVYSAANTMAFEDYDYVRISLDTRREVRDERGVLRAFDDWEIVSEETWQKAIDGSWSFRMLNDAVDPAELCVVFEVTDSQMNRYCSEPRPLRVSLAEADEIVVSYDDCGSVRVGSISLSALQGMLLLNVDVQNITGAERLIRLEDLTINRKATGLAAYSYGSGASGGLLPEEEQTITVMIPFSVLPDEDIISEMTFDLIIADPETGSSVGAVPVMTALRFMLDSGN